MSKLIKRKTTSGAPIGSAVEQTQQSVSEVIKLNFNAWLQSNFPDMEPEENPAFLACFTGGAYTGAKLITDNGIAFVKGALEAHGEAVQTAKAPPIA